MKKILFFSPFQAVPEHSYVERMLGELLQKRGHQVAFLGCDGFMQRNCIAMNGLGLTYDTPLIKNRLACMNCKSSRKENWGSLGNEVMESYLTAADFKEAERIATEVNETNIGTYHYDGFAIGRIASYELILQYKIIDEGSLGEIPRDVFALSVRNTTLTLLSLKKYLKAKPTDTVVVYNANYSVCAMVKRYAESVGTKCVSLGGSLDWGRLYEVFQFSYYWPEEGLRDRSRFFLKQIDQIVAQKEEFPGFLKHVLASTRAENFWIYSEPSKVQENYSNLFLQLGLDPSKPTAMIALSCSDEPFGTDFAIFGSTYFQSASILFEDQVDCLKWLIEYFKKNPQFQLVIRLHPREFPNKREQVQSKRVKKYTALLGDLPPNVAKNYPSDKISIYDLFRVIKVNLTAYSTAGLEACWFGVPTIAYTKGIAFYCTEGVNFVPSSTQQYEEYLSKFLNEKTLAREESVLKGYRWLLFDIRDASIEFELNGYWKPTPLKGAKGFLTRAKRKAKLKWRNYSEYQKAFSISDSELSVVYEFFESGKELYEIKIGKKTQFKSTDQQMFIEGLKKEGFLELFK